MIMDIDKLQDVLVRRIELEIKSDHGDEYIEPSTFEYLINDRISQIVDKLLVLPYE